MPVNIQVEANLSPGQLVQLKENGHSVDQTPHVGNHSLSNLVLFLLGLTAKLVDITIGHKDNLFYPHAIIQDGVCTPIACHEKMTTHNTVHGTEITVSDFHAKPLIESGFNIPTHSQWLADKSNMALRVIKAVSEDQLLRMWMRYVNANGSTSMRTPYSKANLLGEIHKVTAGHNEAGWVIPNPINILLDLVAGTLETNKDTVYMLSGQSMYRYISKDYARLGSMDKLISHLYGLVRDKAYPNLPKTLTVKMVPTPVIRNFVSPLKLKDQLETKLGYYTRLLKGNARDGRKLSEGIITGSRMKYFRHKREHVFQQVSKNLSHICRPSETGNFYTQHDLAKNQDSIYVPSKVMDMTFSEMILISNKMNQIIK